MMYQQTTEWFEYLFSKKKDDFVFKKTPEVLVGCLTSMEEFENFLRSCEYDQTTISDRLNLIIDKLKKILL